MKLVPCREVINNKVLIIYLSISTLCTIYYVFYNEKMLVKKNLKHESCNAIKVLEHNFSY